ncbi:MAG: hypothetical protein V4538_00340 [Bacteroidota bacterium]
MTNWNKTGKVKAIILAVLALPNLVLPIAVQGEKGFLSILLPFVFGSIAILFIAKFNEVFLKREIIKPTWNDNPLTLKRPLSFFHFGSFFFITVGLSILLGSGIKFQMLSFVGLSAISFGLGMLAGIWLTLKWTNSK